MFGVDRKIHPLGSLFGITRLAVTLRHIFLSAPHTHERFLYSCIPRRNFGATDQCQVMYMLSFFSHAYKMSLIQYFDIIFGYLNCLLTSVFSLRKNCLTKQTNFVFVWQKNSVCCSSLQKSFDHRYGPRQANLVLIA